MFLDQLMGIDNPTFLSQDKCFLKCLWIRITILILTDVMVAECWVPIKLT